MVVIGSCNLDEIPGLSQIWIFSQNSFLHIASLDANSFLINIGVFQDSFYNYEDWFYDRMEDYINLSSCKTIALNS